MLPLSKQKHEEQLEAKIHENHVSGLELKALIESATTKERSLHAQNTGLWEQLRSLRKHPSPQVIRMYDSITPDIPANAEAVAGYVGGNWPDYIEFVKRYPRALHVSIAVTAGEDADCLDVENGDATPWQAPAWVRRQQHRGIKRPIIYANLSTMPLVQVALRSSGISRADVLLWVAHYTYHPFIPKGYDACQFDDKALGRNLDLSVCYPHFFGGK